MSSAEFKQKRNHYLRISLVYLVALLLCSVMSNSVCITYSTSGSANTNSVVGMIAYIALYVSIGACFIYNSARCIDYRYKVYEAEYNEGR